MIVAVLFACFSIDAFLYAYTHECRLSLAASCLAPQLEVVEVSQDQHNWFLSEASVEMSLQRRDHDHCVWMYGLSSRQLRCLACKVQTLQLFNRNLS